jgi:hypothetical protein
VLTGWKKIAAIPVYPLFWLFTKDSISEAQITLHTTYEKSEHLKNDGYYDECKLGELNPFAKDLQNEKTLWQHME